jgi:hypothetical protein
MDAVVRLEVEEDGERAGVRVLEAAGELHDDLVRFLPDDAVRSTEGEGEKGDPVTLLSLGVALVASGAVTELIRCVRDWLGRRPRKSRLVVRGSDGTEVVAIDAENVDDPAVAEAIEAYAATQRTG